MYGCGFDNVYRYAALIIKRIQVINIIFGDEQFITGTQSHILTSLGLR